MRLDIICGVSCAAAPPCPPFRSCWARDFCRSHAFSHLPHELPGLAATRIPETMKLALLPCSMAVHSHSTAHAGRCSAASLDCCASKQKRASGWNATCLQVGTIGRVNVDGKTCNMQQLTAIPSTTRSGHISFVCIYRQLLISHRISENIVFQWCLHCFRTR